MTDLIRNALVPIAALHPHTRNYRKHPEAQIARIMASLQRFGQVRSVVAQEGADGRYLLVAGHGLTTAAQQLGLAELRVDVIPASWSAADIEGYLVADNSTSLGAEDDLIELAQLLEEQKHAGYDLASLGFTEEGLDQLLADLADEALGRDADDPDGGGDDFEPSAEIEQTRVVVGDIWQLGPHRIGCLNSCDPADVAKLISDEQMTFVWADPPYGIAIVATNVSVGGGEAYAIPFGGVKNRKGHVGGSAAHMAKTGKPYIAERLGSSNGAKPFGSHVRGSDRAANMTAVGKYHPIIGDETTDTAITSFQLCADQFPKAVQVWWGANYYAHALPPSKCWIVWDKENTGNFADAELAWCSHDSAVRIFKHMWNGLMKASEKGQRRVHPTQKPIALAAWAFEKYGADHDRIFDPFLGSGMSVIAAERTNRIVYGCELSPEYINIILTRWEAETGQTATLLHRESQGAA